MILALLLGCADAEPAPAGAGETRAVVFRALSFARRNDDGTTWGFDLDGRVSDAADPDGCYRADLQTPDGVAGVDSAFSGMVPALEATEAGAVEGLIADSINNGQLLLIAEVSGVDHPTDDPCVDVRLWRAVGTPMVGTDGLLLDGQSFAVDPALSSAEMSCVPMVGGAVVAAGLDLDLPLQVLDVEVEFHVTDGAIRVDFDEAGGAWGYFGGGVANADVLRIVEEEEDLASLRDLVVGLVEAAADLRTDTGCDALSIVFEFEGVPAWVVE